MSMMKTLAKVAIGVAVAKGVSGMMKQSGSSRSAAAPSGQGGLFGGTYSPGAPGAKSPPPSGGEFEDMLGSLLGGRQGSAQPGGLGGLLEQLATGGSSGGPAHGGMNDLMRGTVKKPATAPSFGDDEEVDAPPQRGFGDLLNQAIATQNEPEIRPSANQEAMAALMLRAMIMAMKSDGEIDAGEQARLMDRLGDISREEQAFVQSELRAPLDADAIAREVPRGLEQQVYVISVMGIDLDNQREAQYLHDLASSMGIPPKAVNQIHDHLGVPRIYA